MESLIEELAWLWFFVPRQGVQELGRLLPLSALRDRLPRAIGERLRLGLYPARVTDPQAVTCARTHPAWGEPPELDAATPVRYDGPVRASVIVVTYGNLDLTRLCLCALQRAAGTVPFEVLVVDNCSTDGTQAYLQQVAESGLLPLRAVYNDTNLGFAAANNQGAGLAGGEVLVFLNNDTVVVPGWLDRLVEHLDQDPSVGLIGPVSNSCGNEAQVTTEYRDLVGMQRFAAAYVGARRGQIEDIPMLTLFCAAMHAGLFRQIGGLDEGYGRGLFEDDDLSEAVRQRGYRVALARDVFVHHYGGASFGRLPGSEYLRLWWQNRRRYERKWGKRWVER